MITRKCVAIALKNATKAFNCKTSTQNEFVAQFVWNAVHIIVYYEITIISEFNKSSFGKQSAGTLKSHSRSCQKKWNSEFSWTHNCNKNKITFIFIIIKFNVFLFSISKTWLFDLKKSVLITAESTSKCTHAKRMNGDSQFSFHSHNHFDFVSHLTIAIFFHDEINTFVITFVIIIGNYQNELSKI